MINMTGHISINGQVVDPDGFDDVHRASQGIPVEQRMGSDSMTNLQDIAQDTSNNQTSTQPLHFGNHKSYLLTGRYELPKGTVDDYDADSDAGHYDPLKVDPETFLVLSKDTKLTLSRSQSFIERKTLTSLFDHTRHGSKPSSSRQALEDFFLARRDPNWSPGDMSDYSVEQHPSPKPEGEGKFDLVNIFDLATNNLCRAGP